MKVFVVTAINIGKDSDFKPRCEGIFNNREEAESFVLTKMGAFVHDCQECSTNFDFDNYCVQSVSEKYGTKWNIDVMEYF